MQIDQSFCSATVAGACTQVSQRPGLFIDYEIMGDTMGFDPALGADFAPASMTANSTINLPVTVTNKTDNTWNKCVGQNSDLPDPVSHDCYRIGYRWLDKDRNPVAVSGMVTTPLPAAINGKNQADGSYNSSGTVSVPIKTPSFGLVRPGFDGDPISWRMESCQTTPEPTLTVPGGIHRS
jgi:hypothetical protein